MLQTLGPHEHLCLLYESLTGWRAAIVPFLLQGLRRGERCLHLADAAAAERTRHCLAECQVDLQALESSGRLSFTDLTRACEAGLDARQMAALLISEAKQAARARYPALRLVADVSTVLGQASDLPGLLELEVRLRRDLLARHRCLALCQYDRTRVAPAVAEAVVRTHPFLAVGSLIVRNPACEAPERMLASLSERRKGERSCGGAGAQSGPATPCEGLPALPRGDEVLLLVEADRQVRQLVARTLRDLGYTVLEASETRDIPRRLRRHRGPVDLLLTDIVPGQADGFTLAHALADQLETPGLVLLSACTSRAALGAAEGSAGEDLLLRASAITALAGAVRQVLDARGEGRATRQRSRRRQPQ
ncbi:MAG: MEDS domain-containing protein [Anaerolineae bacterium]|nr:MEDS domain-containing protein [Anaerolineae bacterium]